MFATLTDGYENASAEWTEATVKQEIKRREKEDDWVFVHIGVGTEGWSAASRMAAGTMSVSNVLRTDAKNIHRSFAKTSSQTISYASAVSNNDQDALYKLKSNFFEGDTDDTKS